LERSLASGSCHRVRRRTLGLTLVPFEVRQPDQFAPAFAGIARDRIDSLLAFESPMNVAHRQQIIEFAAAHRMPTVFGVKPFVEAGGLLSYGTDFADLYRKALGLTIPQSLLLRADQVIQ
jgi:putative tryptophan/tyrosine transport system substrate-binding protein